VAKTFVLDTTVMIDQERANTAAKEYVSKLLVFGSVALHPVTRAELLSGARDAGHLRAIRAMLSPFPLLAVKNSDFLAALDLLESNVLAARVGWPDCLIAATCRRMRATLVTLNDRDFRVCAGLKVTRPY
jgi:predicted nucleic acid-binding protein